MEEDTRFCGWRFAVLSLILIVGNWATSMPAAAQATYTAQLTGVVTDASGGVVPGARVMLTDEATNLGTTHATDAHGIYVFTGVRPATYSIRVEAPGMAAQDRK